MYKAAVRIAPGRARCERDLNLEYAFENVKTIAHKERVLAYFDGETLFRVVVTKYGQSGGLLKATGLDRPPKLPDGSRTARRCVRTPP